MNATGPAIGVDVGGTKIAVGLIESDGTVTDSVAAATPEQATGIPAAIVELIGQIASPDGFHAVGIGAAGFVTKDRSTIRFAPNIDWVDMPLGTDVEQRVQVPVVVENDANAAAWGEFRFGAGRGVDDLLLVTIGTGVGGGMVVGGNLVRGGSGTAAEVGHLRVVPDGRLCGCGQRGCLEQYASGSALVAAGRERLTDAADISGTEITHRAQAGDPVAMALLAEVGDWAGQGIASLAAVLDPSMVVIGGGVSAAGDLLLEPLREAFNRHLTGAAHRPAIDIRLATLGNRAGMIGAADLTRFAR